MKYYLDTEFAESRGSIKLISIGIVDSEGNTFYAENACFNIDDANEWVKENVIPKLRWHEKIDAGKGYNNVSNQPISIPYPVPMRGMRFGRAWEVYGSPQVIRDSLKAFLELPQEKGEVDFEREFYAYYSAYDWVVFCWIFGTMTDLPDVLPMFCHDLKPMLDASMIPHPDEPIEEHNALADAQWNMQLHNLILANK